MIRNKILPSCFLFLITISLFGQTIKLSENGFSFNFVSRQFNYEIKDSLGLQFIDYYEFTDPSNEGHFKLPKQNIIIAIPPNSNPQLNYSTVNSKILQNAIPVLNPKVKLINDSTLAYINSGQRMKFGKLKPVVEIVNTFWFRDFYCAELVVRTHQFDLSSNQIIINNNINIEIKFDRSYESLNEVPLKVKSKFDYVLKEIIYNQAIAEQFRSNTITQKFISDDWIDYTQNYIKIAVVEDKLYKLTKNDFDQFGIPTSTINPRTFMLFESGNEEKIYVEGESDNSFDNGDYILFYGHKNYANDNYREINNDDEPYNTYLNRYTDTTFYFLTWGGQLGARIKIDSSSNESVSGQLNYSIELRHFEQNSWYQNANNNEVANQTPDWNKNKAWYWNWLFTSPRNFTINLDDLYPGHIGKVYFKATSWGSNITNNAHQVTLKFNDVKIDSQNIDRFDQFLLQGEILPANLNDGSNTITALNYDNGTVPNVIAYDWYEVEYPRYNRLVDDSIFVSIPEGYDNDVTEVIFSNTSSDSYEIFKLNDTGKKIENYSLISDSLTFIDTISTGDKYIVLGSEKVTKPEMDYIAQFENIRSNPSQADYIAITTKKFSSKVQSYLSQISSIYNLSTKLFFVEDIFNEFGYGYPTPESIKDFIQFAFGNWVSPKPSYLVLFGDATYDYKGYVYDNVGVKLSENDIPSYGIPVSDNWYAIWGDGPFIPQLKVGRIPMLQESDLDFYLSKIQNNFNSQFDDWNKRYLFFSGGIGSDPNELKQLKAANDSLISRVIEPRPLSGNYTHFYKTLDPVSDFGPYTPEEITKAIDNGGVFISYVGHSGTATWDNSINDVNQLKNEVGRNPIISDFGCSTNKFAEPDIVCFGERFLLNPNGQALNYVGNSSLGFTSTAYVVPQYFYESFLNDSLNEIGNAHLYAKSRLYEIFGNSSVFKVFALSNVILGDPAVRIKIPKQPNLIIDSKSILTEDVNFNDLNDSIAVPFIITNLGRANLKNYSISIKHYYENNIIETKSINSVLPGFKDTLEVWINIKELAGKHTLEIIIDPDNEISELNEDDNSTSKEFNVYSSALKDLLIYKRANGKPDSLKILNPISFSQQQFSILAEFSESEEFSNPIQLSKSADTLITKIDLPNLNGSRYWMRYKIDDPQFDYSSPKSFDNSGFKYSINDEFTFNELQTDNLVITSSGIKLSTDTLNISVLSAGWYSGATCVIAENSVNLLDNSFFAGMGIVVFDDLTMKIDTATWFQLYANRPNAEALADLINDIPDGRIVVMGVADDGQNQLISELRTAIKTLGSTKIDSLQFRGSWGIIGRKGASPGDPGVIEDVNGPYEGSVYLEKEYIVPNSSGYLITNELGPVYSWDSLFVDYNLPPGSSIQVLPLGIKANGLVDTLNSVDISSNYTSLAEILDAQIYPRAKFKFQLKKNGAENSPEILSIGVQHKDTGELAINYQTVNVSRDTVIEGETVNINFKAANVGEGRIINVDTRVDLYKENIFVKTIFDSTLLFLDPNTWENLSFDYTTLVEDAHGNFNFLVKLDPQNKVMELFEDNNEFEIPLVVLEDTVTALATAEVSAAFDGYQIYDGDYVSPNPQIDIQLDYAGDYSIVDTNSVEVLLNQERISQSEMSINNDLQAKRITLSFNRKLEDGDYTLSVIGDNLRPAEDDKSEFVRFFKVSSESKILYAYNYPNPLSSNTYFTFKLTQVPNKLRIKIYTIAGRLVKEIEVQREELNFDFNRIFWDGRDEDGDLLANGVYIYKIISENSGKKITVTNKLAVVR